MEPDIRIKAEPESEFAEAQSCIKIKYEKYENSETKTFNNSYNSIISNGISEKISVKQEPKNSSEDEEEACMRNVKEIKPELVNYNSNTYDYFPVKVKTEPPEDIDIDSSLNTFQQIVEEPTETSSVIIFDKSIVKIEPQTETVEDSSSTCVTQENYLIEEVKIKCEPPVEISDPIADPIVDSIVVEPEIIISKVEGASVDLKDSPDEFPCETCNMVFKSKNAFVKHLKSHKAAKPFKCPEAGCTKAFRVEAYLRTHLKYHEPLENRKFPCEICGKRFIARHDMLKHTLVHSEARPWECEACKKRFKSKAKLFSHSKVHDDHRPFRCPICPSAFKFASSLRMHSNLHRPEFNFECSFCNKKFKLKKYLNRHMEIHVRDNITNKTGADLNLAEFQDYDQNSMEEEDMGEDIGIAGEEMDEMGEPLEIIVKEEEVPVQIIVEENDRIFGV